MIAFLNQLIADFDNVSVADSPLPDQPVEEGEKVIGTLDAEHKKLFALSGVLHGKLQRLQIDHQHLHIDLKVNPDDKKKRQQHEDLLKAQALLGDQFDTVRQIFWSSIRSQFPEATTGELVIREGHQVVLDLSPTVGNVLEELLSHLMPGR